MKSNLFWLTTVTNPKWKQKKTLKFGILCYRTQEFCWKKILLVESRKKRKLLTKKYPKSILTREAHSVMSKKILCQVFRNLDWSTTKQSSRTHMSVRWTPTIQIDCSALIRLSAKQEVFFTRWQLWSQRERAQVKIF